MKQINNYFNDDFFELQDGDLCEVYERAHIPNPLELIGVVVSESSQVSGYLGEDIVYRTLLINGSLKRFNPDKWGFRKIRK